MKKFITLALIVISLILAVTVYKINEKPEFKITLDDQWYVSTEGVNGNYVPGPKNNLLRLKNYLNDKQGFICLKQNFSIPEEYKDRDLHIYLGSVKIASYVYFNDKQIGTIGHPEVPFSNGERVSSFPIPSSLINYSDNNENTLILKIYVNSTGKVSTTPFISDSDFVIKYTDLMNFGFSKLLFVFSLFLFVVSAIYYFLYILRNTDKQFLSFSRLNFFSAFYLFSYCFPELPLQFYSIFSNLMFEKIFNGIISIITGYFAISFIRDYLNCSDTKKRKIFRHFLTWLPCIMLLLAPNSPIYYTILGLSYLFLIIHLVYAIKLIIITFIKKNAKIHSLLIGFSPVLISILLTLILLFFYKKFYVLIIVLGWQITILSFVAILLLNFSRLHTQIEYLNANLEKKVLERTNELSKKNNELEEINAHLEYEKECTEKEIELATFVQKSFYRLDIPKLKGWNFKIYNKALMGVSGDMYDIFYDGENLQGFSIFDVSGHGISSGLVTMLVKNIIFQEFLNGFDKKLDKVMSIINERVIEEKGQIENFLTGILVRLNKTKIEMVNAGHPNALLYRAKTKEIEIIDRCIKGSSGAIGIQDFPTDFETVQVKMNKGDYLLLYTDGIIECMNPKFEEYGINRLISCFKKNINLPLDDQINKLINDSIKFAKGNTFNDDVTILLFNKES